MSSAFISNPYQYNFAISTSPERQSITSDSSTIYPRSTLLSYFSRIAIKKHCVLYPFQTSQQCFDSIISKH